MKKANIFKWVSTSIIFLWEGLMPMGTLIFTPQFFNAGTKPLGYPDYFAVALILFKFLGATAILLPKLSSKIKEWAYAGLSFNIIFAIISHAVVDGNIGFILLPVIIGIILGISYKYNQTLSPIPA